jgi:transcriptional regulator with XRE-family HTH domain
MSDITIIKSWYALSDPDIVREIGMAIRRMRLQRNMTQQDLAARAGIDRLTVGKLENGNSTSLLTLIQILRTLEQLEKLSGFEDQPVISPLQAARLQGNPRRRASGRRKSTD